MLRVVSQREKKEKKLRESRLYLAQNWIGKDKTSLLTKGSRHGRNRSSDLNQATLRSIRRHKRKSRTSHNYNFAEHLPNGRSRTRDLFSYVYDLQKALPRTVPRGKKKYFSLHFPTFFMRCAITKEIQRDSKFTYDLSMIYFFTNSSRQFYVKQFRKTIFDHFTVQTGDNRLTRMSINGMQIKASEQIKKRQIAKSVITT